MEVKKMGRGRVACPAWQDTCHFGDRRASGGIVGRWLRVAVLGRCREGGRGEDTEGEEAALETNIRGGNYR